jgi:hypothetical protein
MTSLKKIMKLLKHFLKIHTCDFHSNRLAPRVKNLARQSARTTKFFFCAVPGICLACMWELLQATVWHLEF